MSPRYKEVYIPDQAIASNIERQITLIGGSFELMKEVVDGLPNSSTEKRERERLRRAANALYRSNIFNWSNAFELIDPELLGIDGIGSDSLRAIRRFQSTILSHKEKSQIMAGKKVLIARSSPETQPHGIVVDGIFIPPIIQSTSAGLPTLFINLLRGRTENVGRSMEVAAIRDNLQFLNDNFGLGLGYKHDQGKTAIVLFIPRTTIIVEEKYSLPIK